MSQLQLSENEYSLVRIALGQASMAPSALNDPVHRWPAPKPPPERKPAPSPV